MTEAESRSSNQLPTNFHDVLTINEVAAFLRIPRSSVYKLAQTGSIPCRKVGRHWRFSHRALQSWLEASGASYSYAVKGNPPNSADAPHASGNRMEG
jgi:excisionase family DNA binding protein